MSVVLLGAGCASGPSLTSCDTITDHDSCIQDGVDEALVGTWILESQSLSAQSQSITSPFHGRTLIIGNNGTYADDYSTEVVQDVVAGGITSSCDVLGSLSGSYVAESNLNLNIDPPPTVNELHIVPNGGSPKVTCQATGAPSPSNASTLPLGWGPVEGNPPYVLYTYTMSEDWNTLTIVQTNTIVNTVITYVFTR